MNILIRTTATLVIAHLRSPIFMFGVRIKIDLLILPKSYSEVIRQIFQNNATTFCENLKINCAHADEGPRYRVCAR